MGAFILNAGAETLEAAETAVQSAAGNDIATWFVVVMGIGIVFIGLVCLILLITAMGAIMKRVNAKQEAEHAAALAAQPLRKIVCMRRKYIKKAGGAGRRRRTSVHQTSMKEASPPVGRSFKTAHRTR